MAAVRQLVRREQEGLWFAMVVLPILAVVIIGAWIWLCVRERRKRRDLRSAGGEPLPLDLTLPLGSGILSQALHKYCGLIILYEISPGASLDRKSLMFNILFMQRFEYAPAIAQMQPSDRQPA